MMYAVLIFVELQYTHNHMCSFVLLVSIHSQNTCSEKGFICKICFCSLRKFAHDLKGEFFFAVGDEKGFYDWNEFC